MVNNFNFMETTWKYIVYETTNLINGKIYVGMHKTKDPNVFDGYIGNGIYITQPYTYQFSKTAFQCAVKKYGVKNFIRKTLAVFNTEEEASELEAQIVNEKFLEREDVYNMTLGGTSGLFISQQIRVYQYDLTGVFINEYASFADAALVMGCDYTLVSYAVRKKSKAKGYYWNTDRVDKLNLEDYNQGLNHQIAVYCYNKTGEFYKEFKNQTQASKELCISTSAIKESRLTGSCACNKYYFCTIKADSYDKARKQYIESRPVYRYNSDGSFDKGYATQIEAEIENATNITKAIKLKTPDANGYIWGIVKLDNYNIPKIINKKRQVGKYDLSGNLVKMYDSATKAAKEDGTSVWKVLSGINQTHKGHIYKYID